MGLQEKIAEIVSEADFDGDPWEVTIHKKTFRALADRILAIHEIAEALERKCDLCDETGKETLRCNECAQIMASDY